MSRVSAGGWLLLTMFVVASGFFFAYCIDLVHAAVL